MPSKWLTHPTLVLDTSIGRDSGTYWHILCIFNETREKKASENENKYRKSSRAYSIRVDVMCSITFICKNDK